MIERFGAINFAGKEATVIGEELSAGQPAPDFSAQADDWTMTQVLEATKGKVRIIAALPSLNTSVCDREARRFNQEAASLGQDVAVIAISNDLPFTLKNWCAASGVDQVLVLSDHLELEFGKKYGVLIKEVRVLRRAVFVVDRNDKIVYAAYMPTIGMEPDYEAVLEAAKNAL